MGPKGNHKCPIWKAEGDLTQTQRRRLCEYEAERDLKVVALKAGPTRPQAKECEQPPELRRQRTDSALEPLERTQPFPRFDLGPVKLILDFGPLDL